MFAQLQSRWTLVALIVSAALVAGAHAFETFGHLAPCTMCLAQREWHWGVVGIALVALATRRGALGWTAFVLALAYVGSFAMAMWHVAVEQHWVAATCEASTNFNNIRPLDFNDLGPMQIPHCDIPQWNLFGITMAGYNAMISLAMAVASFFVAYTRERTS